MSANSKLKFESAMVDLLGLPEGVRQFTLKCSIYAIPLVTCEYEVWDRNKHPKIRDGIIQTLKETYEIKLVKKEK